MEFILSSVVVFIFGTILGSFLCVLADRLPRGEQVISGRSKCDKCGHVLRPIDMIPVASYILLRGKCSHCHKKIPLHVFLTELGAGFIATGLFLYSINQGLSLTQFLLTFFVFLFLLGIFLSDTFTGIIPDEFVIAIVVFSLLLQLLTPSTLIISLVTAFICFGLFLALFLVTRGRGMGFGDVKLSFALGLFLGFPGAIIGLYVAFLTGAVISLILILLRLKKLHGDTIAFGPFLVLGIVIAYFFQGQIWRLVIK